MLDTKSTFDHLVTANAATPDQAQRILDNRFYRNVSGALGGTQEYMAMEKLHELHESGDYDLIVVDTPPTRHALDFLDAPRRLVHLLDNRIFRMLMMPTRAYLRVASVAVQTFLRTVARVVGSEVIDDVVAFFRAFEGMEAGFRDHALAVEELLGASDTAFVLVSSPRRDAIEEAQFFARQLERGGQQIDALIVNRVHPLFGNRSAVRPARRRRPSSAPAPANRPRPRSGWRSATRTSPTSARSRSSNGSTWRACTSGSARRRSRSCPTCRVTCTTSARCTRSAGSCSTGNDLFLGRGALALGCRPDDDDPRSRRGEVGTRPGPVGVRRPGPGSGRGHPRPRRA